jgi:hypothetical protein
MYPTISIKKFMRYKQLNKRGIKHLHFMCVKWEKEKTWGRGGKRTEGRRQRKK